MNKIYFIILFIIYHNVYGQNDSIQNNNFKYSIRGKALAGPTSPEDDMAATYTIGNEFLYKRHSLGIDFTSFRFNHETDDIKDNPLFDNFVRRRYFLIDYKFLIKKNHWGNVYFNLYDKIGRYKEWYKVFNDYTNLNYLNNITINGIFNDPGIGLGVKKYWGKFGLDISLNYSHRFENNNSETVISPTQINYTKSYHEKDLIYARFNLFYEFDFVKNKKQKANFEEHLNRLPKRNESYR